MGQDSVHCHSEIFIVIICVWCMYVPGGKKQLCGISSVFPTWVLGIKLRSSGKLTEPSC